MILDPDDPIEGVNDSKKLSEKRREALYEEIIQRAVAYQVVFISPQEIDEKNILWGDHGWYGPGGGGIGSPAGLRPD